MTQFKKNFESLVKGIMGGSPNKDWYTGLTGLALIFTFLHLSKKEREALHPKLKGLWANRLLNFFWDKVGAHSGWYASINGQKAKIAWNRILKAGYISDDNKFEIDKGVKINDVVFWGLFVNVANGFLKRKTKSH